MLRYHDYVVEMPIRCKVKSLKLILVLRYTNIEVHSSGRYKVVTIGKVFGTYSVIKPLVDSGRYVDSSFNITLGTLSNRSQ